MSYITKKETHQIYLPLATYHKMLGYALASEGEISGFGRVTTAVKDKVTIFTVEDVRIFKQKVSSVHTSLDNEALSRFVVELAQEDIEPSDWNCWWHSHYDFNTFFSATDSTTIDKLCKNSSLVSICINQDGDLSGRFDQNGKEVCDDIKIIVEQEIADDLLKACKEEVKEKVKFERIKSIRTYKPVEPLPSFEPFSLSHPFHEFY